MRNLARAEEIRLSDLAIRTIRMLQSRRLWAIALIALAPAADAAPAPTPDPVRVPQPVTTLPQSLLFV